MPTLQTSRRIALPGMMLQCMLVILARVVLFNPLTTKRRLLYLKIHLVPRSKHFSSRL